MNQEQLQRVRFETLACVSPLDTPSQRVQFILGTEDDDEEHIPHDLFTELDELAFRDGHTQEWKETARQGHVSHLTECCCHLFNAD